MFILCLFLFVTVKSLAQNDLSGNAVGSQQSANSVPLFVEKEHQHRIINADQVILMSARSCHSFMFSKLIFGQMTIIFNKYNIENNL